MGSGGSHDAIPAIDHLRAYRKIALREYEFSLPRIRQLPAAMKFTLTGCRQNHPTRTYF
jgi:hypothetical protein